MCSLLLPGIASAQSTPTDAAESAKASDPNDIVVTARKPLERSEAEQFVRSASDPIDRQLAKFDRYVCPLAIGFPKAVGVQIEDRMRDVAEAAGANVAKRGCKGNTIVIAATDGADMIRQMERLQTPMIAGLAPREIRALIRDPAPVRSWTTSEAHNANGVSALEPAAGGPQVLEVYTGSNLNPPTQQSIQIAVVVIEWSALIGKSVVQIADYAAMRTLARTKPVEGGGSVDTILALFNGKGAGPSELSAADLDYLISLYRTSGMRYANTQIGEIARAVQKGSAASK